METNTATVIYSIPTSNAPEEARDDAGDKMPIWQLPKILWASAILFAANLIIAAGIAASPELNVDIYGEAAGDLVLAGTKPSPFVDPEPQKPRAVRAAVKLSPVIELNPEVLDIPRTSVHAASYRVELQANIPAAYRQPAYVSGDEAYRAAESQIDLTRTTGTGSVMLRKTVY
jgi:hypothetical protein